MKLRTEMVSFHGTIVLTVPSMDDDVNRAALRHDAAAAHALKQAEREADALFNASTRWFRARAWINTRADELMSQWDFDSGEVRGGGHD